MSFQVMSWAVNQKCGSAAAKMVLMMLANHTNGHTNRCNPRHKTLAEECEMRVETLKNHLKNLEQLGLITIIPQFSDGVQLANHYQLNSEGGGGDFRTGGGGEKRMGGGGDFRTTVKQEVKQEDNQRTVLGYFFDQFWFAYPKKVGKDTAKKAFEKRKPDSALLRLMIEAIDRQKESPQWQKDEGQYIPNPATWLNGGRWMDEVTDESSSLLAGGI